MSDTFSQVFIHIVFAVKGRRSLISRFWEDELFKYITGIITRKGQKLIQINGMPDHIHILIGMKPTCCLSDLVREIKKASNEFIKEKRFCPGGFNWQEGFGAFSVGLRDLDRVCLYIITQKQHHGRKTFREEYVEILIENGVEYKPEYLFEEVK